MRLLILWPDPVFAGIVRDQMELEGWDVMIRQDGRTLCQMTDEADVLLLHLCLPGLDGLNAGDAYAASCPVCPPRILLAAPPEWCVHHPSWADCTVDTGIDLLHLCQLLRIIARKPLPKLASAQQKTLAFSIERFLDDLSFKPAMKGRAYAAWLLQRIVPATPGAARPLGEWYAECAQSFQTSAAAVERCLRVAVESVFTQGSLAGIERFFGATVDPERGKPTNRAFLMQAAQQLRYSLAVTRSLNKSEMHHNPAAPTSV